VCRSILIRSRFLLTKLHLDAICRKARYNKKALREAVKQLPTQLDQTFEDALQRINSQNVDDITLAKQVLAWVHFSHSAIDPLVLQQALAKQRHECPAAYGGPGYDRSESNDDFLIEEQLLVSVCAGLVVINKESREIRLVHFTVEEYFDRCFDQFYPNALVDVNYTCLGQALDSQILRDMMDSEQWLYAGDYLGNDYNWDQQQKDDEQEIGRRLSRVPFSEYAIFHLSTMFEDEGTRKSKALQFRKGHWSVSRRVEQAYTVLFERSSADGLQALKIATFFHNLADVRRIIESLPNGSPVGALASCLAYASLRGYDDIVQLLLEANADANQFFQISNRPCGSGFHGFNSLGCAIQGRNPYTVRMLLGKSAELTDLPIEKMENWHNHPDEPVVRTAVELISDLMKDRGKRDTDLETILDICS
jgi:hypothetical protein